jgi:hypothetical protein
MTDLSRRSALSLALAATAAAAGKPATAQAPTPPDAAGQGQREPDATVAQGNSAAIDPASIAALRIYPPLAIARVGNAIETDAYVIGPEVIGGPATLPSGGAARLLADFRTPDGHIKRQAARFRIYAHLKNGSVVEVTAAAARMQWRVVVANLKAGWYDFNQAMDLPRGLSQEALRRNRDLSVPGGRATLDITPTPQSIEGRNAPAVALADGAFWHRPVYLGELRTDADGRLLFFGGRGQSAPFRKGLSPRTFANNTGWHDDVADGPVRATVTFPGAAPIEAEPSYVAVTPPNFAPGLTGLVTMDDAVRETFQHEGWIPKPTSTSFTQDIWPIFDRLTGMQWINHGLFVVHGHGSPLDARNPAAIDRLRNRTTTNRAWRQSVLALFRDPNAGGSFDEPKVPQIYGDGVDSLWDPPTDALGLLSVTATQYAHLQRWSAGDFADDWPGAPPVAPDFARLSPAEQVAHLERAALHDCLGGPFHPGIELTWVTRLPRIWKQAYRLNILPTDLPAKQNYGASLTPDVCIGAGGPFDGVAAGALTRFLGVPWQTDGASCNSAAEYNPSGFLSMPTFWGARVPDQVLAAASYQRAAALDPATSLVQAHKHFMSRVDWLRDVRGPDYYSRIANMVSEWWELGMVLPVASPPGHLPADTRVEQGRSAKAAGADPNRNLVAAVEALALPTQVAQRPALSRRAASPGAQPSPPAPPRRMFRQGEI